MQPRMIRVADIERLQRTMESVPEQRVEEVTTVQAVRMLSSQIHGMQAKGYGLPAIAELLSNNGVVVTAKTLKTYLGEARARRRTEKSSQDQDAADRSGPDLRRRLRRQNRSWPWRPMPPREVHTPERGRSPRSLPRRRRLLLLRHPRWLRRGRRDRATTPAQGARPS